MIIDSTIVILITIEFFISISRTFDFSVLTAMLEILSFVPEIFVFFIKTNVVMFNEVTVYKNNSII